MNGLDLAILGVIALSAVFAFARGFVREALSIVAWVGAALITLYGFNHVYAIVVRFVTTPLLADLIAGAGLFVISLIVLTILTGFLARFVQSSALSPIDRTLGLIFGLARGAVLVSLAYLVLDISLPQNDRPGWIKEAKSEPFLAQGAEMLRNALARIAAGEERCGGRRRPAGARAGEGRAKSDARSFEPRSRPRRRNPVRSRRRATSPATDAT